MYLYPSVIPTSDQSGCLSIAGENHLIVQVGVTSNSWSSISITSSTPPQFLLVLPNLHAVLTPHPLTPSSFSLSILGLRSSGLVFFNYKSHRMKNYPYPSHCYFFHFKIRSPSEVLPIWGHNSIDTLALYLLISFRILLHQSPLPLMFSF